MKEINNKNTEKMKLMDLVHPSPKQKKAFEVLKKSKFLLYGGAMYGGKSYFLRWALVVLLVYFYRKHKIKKVVVGLFCEDYPALKDRHLGKIEMEFPDWLGKMHSDHKAYGKSFILDEEYGGGVIVFRNLDDPSKYASAEFAAIAVDELTKNPIEKFVALRHRLRWPGINNVKFLAGTNPGSIGHVWVKKYWMDKDYPPEEKEKDQFAYVPAKYTDNPEKNEGYENTLNSLPPKLAKAFRDGDWDTFEGQYFEEWNRERNTCKPFEIPKHWMKFIWMDYGYTKPACVHWATIDESGVVFVYRELYVTNHTYIQLAKKIRKMTPEEEIIDRMIADPAIFSKTGHGDDIEPKSGAEEMSEATNGWLAFERGNNERVIGWGVMRDYIKENEIEIGDKKEKSSKIKWFTTCKDAIRTIPALVYDSVKVEDVDTNGEDHAGDCDRYGLMDLFDLFSEKPPKKKPTNTSDAIFERDMEAIQREKEEQENDIDWQEL